MAKIISASEAIKISKESGVLCTEKNKRIIDDQLKMIEQLIKEAASHGQVNRYMAKAWGIKNEVYFQLEKMGYKIIYGFPRDEICISWEHLLSNVNTRTIETISDKAIEICDNCGAEVEIDPNDLREGWLGAYYFTCPVCGSESMDCTIETELPTKDSIEFPKHFSKSSVDNGAVDISDEEIQKVIRELSNKLWDETNERDYVSTRYGNMAVFVENYAGEGEYKITVCKNYWEGSIKANPADEYYGGD